MELVREQRDALATMEKGFNIFLTGKAGSGKSILIEEFLRRNPSTRILAPTGIAAQNVQGSTIHKFCGFKAGITLNDVRPKQLEYIRNLKTIIIDEISMVRCDLLDCLELFLRLSCAGDKPWGGKQIIFVGDLFQLQPVLGRDMAVLEKYESEWFFHADILQKNDGERFQYIMLDHNHRQTTDQSFHEILNSIRKAKITQIQLDEINKHLNRNDDGVMLTPDNKRAEKHNENELKKLHQPVYTFRAKNIEYATTEILEKFGYTNHKELFESHLVEDEISLCIGAKVMILVNRESLGYVNGTIGVITEISNAESNVRLSIKHGDEAVEVELEVTKYVISALEYNSMSGTLHNVILMSFEQMPLKLAWAITIHKSQGLSLDRIQFQPSCFTGGQAYVALSRCRTLDGVSLVQRLEPADLMINSKVVDFHNKLANNAVNWLDKGSAVVEHIEKPPFIFPDYRKYKGIIGMANASLAGCYTDNVAYKNLWVFKKCECGESCTCKTFNCIGHWMLKDMISWTSVCNKNNGIFPLGNDKELESLFVNICKNKHNLSILCDDIIELKEVLRGCGSFFRRQALISLVYPDICLPMSRRNKKNIITMFNGTQETGYFDFIYSIRACLIQELRNNGITDISELRLKDAEYADVSGRAPALGRVVDKIFHGL